MLSVISGLNQRSSLLISDASKQSWAAASLLLQKSLLDGKWPQKSPSHSSTLFKTWPKWQSNIHTHMMQWVLSCAEVRKEFELFSFCLYVCHVCFDVNCKWNTMNAHLSPHMRTGFSLWPPMWLFGATIPLILSVLGQNIIRTYSHQILTLWKCLKNWERDSTNLQLGPLTATALSDVLSDHSHNPSFSCTCLFQIIILQQN